MIVFQYASRLHYADDVILCESFLDHMLHGVDPDSISFLFDESSDGV